MERVRILVCLYFQIIVVPLPETRLVSLLFSLPSASTSLILFYFSQPLFKTPD
jgi:hypothetical protein